MPHTIHNVGFMSLTKTGHSSVNRMFPNITTFPKFSESWLTVGKHYYLKNTGQLKNYTFLFTVVRDPTTRFISSFNECVKSYGYKGNLDEFIVDFREKRLNWIQTWHTESQTKHLILEDLDLIIKLENFDEGVSKLCKMLDIQKPEIVHTNKSKTTQQLTAQQEELIKNIFKNDYELLSY